VRRELELHGHKLTEKPEIIAVSKAELTGSEEVRARLERELGFEILAISAVTGQGLSKLIRTVSDRLAGLAAEVVS
jgi:GTP-binding protein